MTSWATAVGVLVALGVTASVIGGAYALGYRAGGESAEAQQARERRLVQEAAQSAQTAAAVAIAGIEVKNVTQRQVLQREIVEVPVYRDCKHSDAGLRAVNGALLPPGTDPGAVPAADAPR